MDNIGYFERVAQMTPTSLWINNVTPEEAELALKIGANGCTQNPAYVDKMLSHPQGSELAYKLLDGILPGEPDDDEALAKLQLALIAEVAKKFMPLYESSGGRQGYVTIQGNPFREDKETILAAARTNGDALPNIMAKIPAIPSGLEAMKVLVREGRPILATEVMSVAQALDCARLYQEASAGTDKAPVVYFAHIPGIFDEYIMGVAEREGIDIPYDYIWQAGVAVAKKIDYILRERGYEIGFCSGGARGLHHFTEMVGAKCSVTINYGGSADKLLELDQPVVQNFLRPTPPTVLDALCAKLPDFKKAYEAEGLTPEQYEQFGPVCLFRTNFEKGWSNARRLIAERRAAMVK